MPNENPIVFVVDDDASARAAVESLLGSVGLRVQAFAAVPEFLQQQLPEEPCCLILDVRMPKMSGLELQRELNARKVSIPIIFITGHGDIPMSVEAMKAGALEFLTKPFRGQVLLDAIHKALDRDRVEKAARSRLKELRRRVESLSPREHEVMQGVIAGFLNKEIAGQLGTSERTVKIQRASVMRKMGASSLVELLKISEQISGS